MPFGQQETNSVFDDFELRLNDISKKYLREAAKWAFMLSIVGFILVGLFVLLAVIIIVMSSAVSTNNAFQAQGLPIAFVAFIYIIMAALYFFPVLYLYKFSRKMKTALIEKNTEELTVAFSNLKSFFKFIGVMMLVVIGIFVLIFGFAIIGGIASGF
ncbi:DUF5362 family protein [Kordia algicida OT-1]|uniref:DUF5362 domain-containing protein n=1 Tax=Kordia algicida OT-1 TaxID=391587 RepID=A9DUQ0_9FLAO|nr:DUF5362 family protein [Kordia algicida]EDP96318.1 hypothetical protein KAOT1_02877 [Kordia algicida OT-1]